MHQRGSQRRRLPLDREVVVGDPAGALLSGAERRKNEERCRGNDGGDECTEGEDSRAGLQRRALARASRLTDIAFHGGLVHFGDVRQVPAPQ